MCIPDCGPVVEVENAAVLEPLDARWPGSSTSHHAGQFNLRARLVVLRAESVTRGRVHDFDEGVPHDEALHQHLGRERGNLTDVEAGVRLLSVGQVQPPVVGIPGETKRK